MIPRIVVVAALSVGCGIDSGLPMDPDPAPDPDTDPFPPPEQGVQITSGPIPLGPGEEKTVCVMVDLPTDAELPVVRMAQHNEGTAHHFILFRAGSALDPGVGDCPGGLFVQHAPIYPGTRSQGPFEMPDGVAITLAKRQSLILQLHLLNPSDHDVVEEERINLYAGPTGVAYQKAGVVAGSDYDFQIPPHAMHTATQRCYVTNAMKIFALTTHSHARTIAVDVSANLASGSAHVYHNESWSEPVFGQYAPALELSGFNWLELSCTWFNESGKTITYGESGQDEMCIMFGYYYPATLDATPCIGL